MILKFLLWLGALCLFAGDAAATNVVLLASADRCPSTAGNTLRQIASRVNAAPSTNVTLYGNCTDRKAYTFSPITAPYTGTFDGGGYTIKFTINNSDNCNTLPAGNCTGTAQAFGLFNRIDTGGTFRNATVSGQIYQTGSMLDDTFMTWRVGVASGFNYGTISNVNCTGYMYTAGYYNYDGCHAGENRGAISGGTCSLVLFQNVLSGSSNAGCIVSWQRGTLTNVQVTGGSTIYQSGVTPGKTQTCKTPNPTCPVTGGFQGAAIGAIGFQDGTFGTADHITVSAGVVVTGPIDTTSLIAQTGGIVGILYYGTLSDSTSAATVSGTNGVGGIVGHSQNGGPTTPSAIPSLVQRVSFSGTVTSVVGVAGGIIGRNGGEVSYAENFGTVNCGSAGSSCGGLVGLHQNDTPASEWALLDHAFNWATVTGNQNIGGAVGNQGTVDLLDQVYSVPFAYAGLSGAGGVVGSCGDTGGITNSYWNTTVSLNLTGCGSSTPAGTVAKTTAQFLAAMPAGFDGGWAQNGNAGGYPYLTALATPAAPSFTTATVVLLTTTGSNNWTVVAPCDTGRNLWEAVGESGSAGAPSASTSVRGPGGGAYASTRGLALVLGASTPYTIGAGGSSTKTQFYDSSTLVADFGTSSTTAATGAGGGVANSVGSNKHAGGAGAINTGSNCGAGGGGAGNAIANGKSGAVSANSASNCGGGGGGAGGNGSNGVAAPGTAGGAGGADRFSNPGGTGSSSVASAGGSGTVESGGGGGFSNGTSASAGGPGGPGVWPSGNGPGGGGGGGGGNATAGASGGLGGGYGGAPGGSGRNGLAVAGTQGAIQGTCYP